MFRAAQHQDPADGRPSMAVEDIELLPAADLERSRAAAVDGLWLLAALSKYRHRRDLPKVQSTGL